MQSRKHYFIPDLREPWHVGPSSGRSRQRVLPVSLHAGEAVKTQTQPQQATIPPNQINKGEGCMKDLIEIIDLFALLSMLLFGSFTSKVM